MNVEQYIADIKVSAARIEVVPGSALSKFLNGSFYVEYEGAPDLSNLAEEVAVIPFVLATAPIVWCMGLRLKIDRLDSNLASSLPRLRAAYAAMYPNIEWNGEIEVADSVAIPQTDDAEGMLFSGGLDSVHAALSSVSARGYIFTVWGADTNPDKTHPWQHMRDHAADFARNFGYQPIFIKSNFRKFLNSDRLHTWHRDISHWYTHVQHGPALIGLTAPPLVSLGGRRLVIASSHPAGELKRGWGSSPELDEAIRYGNISISHAADTESRQDKIHQLVSICKDRGIAKMVLRVCGANLSDGSNCGVCEKCLRTAMGFIVEGEDPRDWGFVLDAGETIRVVQRKITRFRFKITANEAVQWSSVQNAARNFKAPTQLEQGIEWFCQLNIEQHRKIHEVISGRRLYAMSPRIVKKLMRNTLYFFKPKKL